MTDDWRVETIDRHVAEVRGMFLRALGQEEKPDGKPGTSRRKQAGKGPAAKPPAAKNSRRTARRRTAR
jgi:hypothetical protein